MKKEADDHPSPNPQTAAEKLLHEHPNDSSRNQSTATCTICRTEKVHSEFSDTFLATCKECAGEVLGAKEYPYCRMCGAHSGNNVFCCFQHPGTQHLCPTCKVADRTRNDFSDQQWPSRHSCMICDPSALEAQWKKDRSAVLRLLERGIQIYHSGPITGGSWSIHSSPSDLYRPLFRAPASCQELVGMYDILYVRWETKGISNEKFGPVYGDVLQQRTQQKSTLSLFMEEGMSRRQQDDSFARLRGEIELADRSPLVQQQDESANNRMDGSLFQKRIHVRFGGQGVAPMQVKRRSLQARASVFFSRHGDVARIGEMALENPVVVDWAKWNHLRAYKVQLRVMARDFCLEWIPRDDCDQNAFYSLNLRRAMDHRKQSKVDWANSWLCHHLALPDSVAQHIYGFLTHPLPDTQFQIKEGDVLLSLGFSNPSFESTLIVNMVARRRR